MQAAITKGGGAGNPSKGKITYRSGVLYDLKPTGDYDTTSDKTDATCVNSLTGYSNSGSDAGDWKQDTSDATLKDDMCTESWAIGETGWACVKIKGRLTRNMTPSETVCDLKFEYYKYPMKIIIGKLAETADKVKFSEASVDFDKLRSATGAHAFDLTLGAFVAGIVAFAF